MVDAKGKVIYQGMFFDDKTMEKLLQMEGSKGLPKKIKDMHVTFAYLPKELLPKAIVGQEYEIEVIGFGCDGKNCGFEVKLPNSLTEIYKGAEKVHITTSLNEGSKAVDTGKLDFVPLGESVRITGKMGVFKEGKPEFSYDDKQSNQPRNIRDIMMGNSGDRSSR